VDHARAGVGRYSEMQRDTARYREIQGDNEPWITPVQVRALPLLSTPTPTPTPTPNPNPVQGLAYVLMFIGGILP